MQNEDVRCPKVKREKQEKGEWYDLSESEGRGQHIQWADYYKAFSILLVVLAHIYYANHAVKPWIHSFNMPAFFFINNRRLTEKQGQNVSKRTWKLYRTEISLAHGSVLFMGNNLR